MGPCSVAIRRTSERWPRTRTASRWCVREQIELGPDVVAVAFFHRPGMHGDANPERQRHCDRLLRIAGQGAEQGGLAVHHAAADQQVPPGPHCGAQKGADERREGASVDQVVQGHVEQPVQPQEQVGRFADPADGEQPGTVGVMSVLRLRITALSGRL
jgi:hypothetical protein